MTGHEIRRKFLEYFKQHGHVVVGSSSLVPADDPTLLFTNAGMNQFKDTFLGRETRSYTRAATCQKVVRAGGKHNDLENVGVTSRHHTFFEMLGNFSFGDYFKVDAIKFGWEFLTKEMGLPADKMFVSVYNDDDEAFAIWRDVIGLDEKDIERRGEKDNFWAMGDTGPCGPCSEIHIDQGEGTGCGRPECDRNCDCDRHLELWNLVFMQFERSADGTLTPLPKPSIDTGMGLERVTSVVQKVTSNYETDLFKPILNYISELAGHKYGSDPKKDISVRVIADHSRSTTFLVGDGVLPSNEGRGYVLRRIMRRAMRHGKMLGFEGAFFHKVCEFVVDFMKGHYVELADKKPFISKVVTNEEQSFSRTLGIGLKIIDELLEKHKEYKVISGEDIFRLYDTYGFPVDLLTDIAEDAGYGLDTVGFEQEMQAQQERAKKSWAGSGESRVADIYIQLASRLSTEFTGYDSLKEVTTVAAIIKDGAEVSKAEGECDIVLAKSPFYPEGGGQTGDCGYIKTESAVFKVTKASKYGDGMITMHGVAELGTIIKGETVTAEVDRAARKATEKNHTATHLLHKALQEVLGDHVRQAGSMVTPDRLRFDFNHYAPVSQDEMERIEETVNSVIQENTEVSKTYMSRDEAVQAGAMALFGEKYGERVRVVSVENFSLELCGGCHVSRTGDIGFFKLVSEASVASGVRRIEAVTGMNAVAYAQKADSTVKDAARLLKASPDNVISRIEETAEALKERERELKRLGDRIASSQSEGLLDSAIEVKGVKLLAVTLENADTEALRKFVDTARDRMQSGVVVVGSVNDGKVMFACGVTKDTMGRVKAGDVVREVAKIAEGSGGGRPDMAMAGGKNPEKLGEAVAAVPSIVEKLIG
ncbi:alanine--tRNA ligase [Seleniivibrio woodruffii]|uniref:Alanine--tRNA ligase n=1 Tax=Seleniivibrio woodruffii TaxID=1078050 RepID=A0A4R1KEJ0_9BACT|nr:alanine--tRNA ligase [Seleniivibrio woodruffii]TCK62500.1 alanyl-tRNA synthetase [Seleniivibrio woodruffii]TVZ37073.1 alanyl-tRNA synthetase [Seleniivibrio woodruffii]